MPSHKEILQKSAADAEREHQAASQEEARLRAEVEATSSKIAELQQRYDSACVQVAQGNPKAENPASILAERDTHGHRLRGLEQVHRAASQRSQSNVTSRLSCPSQAWIFRTDTPDSWWRVAPVLRQRCRSNSFQLASPARFAIALHCLRK